MLKKAYFNLPNMLSFLRLFLNPVILTTALNSSINLFFTLIIINLLTDFLDGYLARKLNQVSSFGSKLDSSADFIFYCTLIISIYSLWPKRILGEIIPLSIIFISYLIPAVTTYLKFGKLPSYHTLGAKLSGIAVSFTVLYLIIYKEIWPVRIVALIRIFSTIEELLICFTLDKYKTNILTFRHALKSKKEISQR